jgi:hypothetical protein
LNYKKSICKDCFVGLDARNVESVRVFFAVRNQFVTIGPSNYPIEVCVNAVKAALDIFEVKERERVFLRVTSAINGHFIKQVQKEFNKK